VVDVAETAWEPGALVPAEPWSGIRVCEELAVLTGLEFRLDRDVALVKVADDGQPRERLTRLGAVDVYTGEHRDVPGLVTQTARGEDGRFLGLHLDNWDGKPAGRRATSRNRASLNLGPEARRFMFVDHDLMAAYAPDCVPDTESARSLVADSSSWPIVVRLTVPPGWAYVAPTETLLHDVSSLGQTAEVRQATALGWFDPAPIGAGAIAICVDADLSAMPRPTGP
jgi:hypothetical protein